MKKVSALVLTVCLFLMSVVAFAGEVDVPFGYGDEYSTSENPFTFVYEYDAPGDSSYNINSRSGILEYGYVTSTANVNVYSSTDKTVAIGYVGYRERVYVLYTAGSMYCIEFKNVNTLTRGFIDANKISFPSYGWERP